MANEEVIKQIMTSSKCDICGNVYEEDNIRIIGNVEDTWILQVYCQGCHSQTLLAATVTVEEDPVYTREENITDLLPEEQELFQNTVITVDDVLDMTLFLRGYNGSLKKLFN